MMRALYKVVTGGKLGGGILGRLDYVAGSCLRVWRSHFHSMNPNARVAVIDDIKHHERAVEKLYRTVY